MILSGNLSGSGNRCGHQPERPVFLNWTPPKTKKDLPKQLQDILSAVDRYYFEPNIMPTLAYQSSSRNKDGSYRQNRSEIRESEVAMLKAVYTKTDWASTRVGVPMFSGRFNPVTHCDIAEEMNRAAVGGRQWTLPDGRPNGSYWAAWHALTKAGAWESFRIYEPTEDGELRAKPAIKKINVDFVVALTGISYAKISKLRKWSGSSTKKKKDQWAKENPHFWDREKAYTAVNRAAGESGTRKKRPNKQEVIDKGPQQPTLESNDQHREIVQYQAELITNHKDKGMAWIKAKVKERYPDYGKH